MTIKRLGAQSTEIALNHQCIDKEKPPLDIRRQFLVVVPEFGGVLDCHARTISGLAEAVKGFTAFVLGECVSFEFIQLALRKGDAEFITERASTKILHDFLPIFRAESWDGCLDGFDSGECGHRIFDLMISSCLGEENKQVMFTKQSPCVARCMGQNAENWRKAPLIVELGGQLHHWWPRKKSRLIRDWALSDGKYAVSDIGDKHNLSYRVKFATRGVTWSRLADLVAFQATAEGGEGLMVAWVRCR